MLISTKSSICSIVQSYDATIEKEMCIQKIRQFQSNSKTVLLFGKQVVPDYVVDTLRNEIHNTDNILYNYDIPLTIPILEHILKKNKLMIYKGNLYYIYFKLSGVPFPCITTKEYNLILNVFDVVSTIYDKYKPKGRKSFLNYYFVLKQILIMRSMVQYAKYISKLKTNSKQKELE